MRKLIVLSFITLDGVMQAPGGPGEDDSGGFKYGGWSIGYFDDFLGNVMTEQMGHPLDLLLGRKTYDIFAYHRPQDKDETGAGSNRAKKHRFKHRSLNLAWTTTIPTNGEVSVKLE